MKKLLFIFLSIALFELIACKKEAIEPTQTTPTVTQQPSITGNYTRSFTEPAEPSENGTVTILLINGQYYMTTPFLTAIFDSLPMVITGTNFTLTPTTNSGCTTQGYGTLKHDSLMLYSTYSCNSMSHSTLYIKQ